MIIETCTKCGCVTEVYGDSLVCEGCIDNKYLWEMNVEDAKMMVIDTCVECGCITEVYSTNLVCEGCIDNKQIWEANIEEE